MEHSLRCARITVFTCLVAVFSSLTSASLPYNPSNLFLADLDGNKVIYILDPPTPDAPHGRLRSISAASDISAGAVLPATTLSPELPFLSDPTVAYTSIFKSDGTIVVYVGHCSGEIPQLWLYEAATNSYNGAGRWSEKNISVGASGSLNYLGRGISFSSLADASTAGLYIFGGMCPDDDNISAASWISAASYSNQMVLLDPDDPESYNLAVTTNQGAPIAEAGFSITSLTPSFSNTTGGTVAQSQNFLLLGGHTQNAFINMSQVAMYSLPQQSWSFYPISQPDAKTNLVRRDAPPNVEPRSGHTAILTSDGSKIVVFGGWVGQVNNPAEPQLAVLELGEGFGGSGSWSWSTPTTNGLPLTSGSGLYGHGAVMLPGDVMMVTGGKSIPSGLNGANFDAALSPNIQTYFYNVSSEEWLQSYDHHAALGGMQDQSSGGILSTSSKKTGFGVGLSLGLLVVGFVLIAALMFWQRAKKQKRDRRDDEQHEAALRDREIEDLWHVSSANFADHNRHSGFGTKEPSGFHSKDYPWNSEETRQGSWDTLRGAERTGYEIDVPSPRRGLRKGRVAYHSVPRREERSTSLGGRPMQPIEEGDEEPSSIELKSGQTEMKEVDDPFKDPLPIVPQIDSAVRPQRSNTGSTIIRRAVSPSEDRDKEMQGWTRDCFEADKVKAQDGRASPDKSERTHSTLSEASLRSNLSSQSKVGARRPLEQSSNPFASPDRSPLRHSTDDDYFRSPPAPHSEEKRDLVAESEALLGKPLPGQARMPRNETKPLVPDLEPTFTRPGPYRTQSRMSGWVGSVRRAVLPTVAGARSASMTSATPNPLGGLVDTTEPNAYQAVDPSSSSSSPTRQRAPRSLMASNPPRRSASDGAGFWASKTSARDWGVESKRSTQLRLHPPPSISNAGLMSASPTSPVIPHSAARTEFSMTPSLADQAGDVDDWDVEEASQNRVVQVMFTAPREKLRVVNADVGSDEDAAEGNDDDDRDAVASKTTTIGGRD